MTIKHSFEGKLYKENAFYRAWKTPYGYLVQRKEDHKFLKFQGSFLLKYLMSNDNPFISIGEPKFPEHVFGITNHLNSPIADCLCNLIVLKTKDSLSDEEYQNLMRKYEQQDEERKKMSEEETDQLVKLQLRHPKLPPETSFEDLDESIQITK